jgi:hypothetical protein
LVPQQAGITPKIFRALMQSSLLNRSNMNGLRGSVLILSLLLLLSFTENENETRQLNADEMREDVAVLRKSLEKYHPGLYWYTSKAQFQRSWDSLKNCLHSAMSDRQFLKLLLPVIAQVKCAHTLFYPSENILATGKRFPFDLKFINGRGFIMTDSVNQFNIPKGSELLKVNGRSLRDIVDDLLPGLEAQGGNLGWKYAILENDFHNYYYYLVDSSDTFEIEYIDQVTGNSVSVTVDGSQENVRRKHWKNWYPIETGPPLKIKYLTNPDIVIITVRSFSKGRYKQYQQNFDKLIDQYFVELKNSKIQNLILDLRGNEGGNNPEKLYGYIANENDKNIDAANSSISQSNNVFRGKVIVLANQRSISAQEVFVGIFINNKRGLVIGQPTPGSFNGLTGGKKRRVVLPNSRFQIQIPMYASHWSLNHATNYHEGGGFPPDFAIEENIEAFLSGRDLAMELALDKMKGP